MIVVNLDNLKRSLPRFRKDLSRSYHREMPDLLGLVEDDVSEYPPETEANRPKFGAWGPYYIRRVGKAYRRKSGGTTIYLTSEQLGDNWKRRTRGSDVLVVGEGSNPVSYADYVHVRRKQASFHKRRGWRTAEDALARQRMPIFRTVVRITERVVRRFNRGGS